MPKSYGMITKETNANLVSIMYSPVILAQLYTEFLNSEAACAKDVHAFLKNYTRLCVTKTGMLNSEEEFESDDFFDMIESANEIEKILMTVFTTGLMYGKSTFYDEFRENFEGTLDAPKDKGPDAGDLF